MASDLLASIDFTSLKNKVVAMSVLDQEKALRELGKYRNLVVTADGLDGAKKVRARLSVALKIAGRVRLEVQRKVKRSDFGAFLFNPTPAEREIKAERERIDADIKLLEHAPSVRLSEGVQTFVCFVRGTQAQVNALAVEANERGLAFENRGPLAEGAAATEEPKV